MRTLIVDDEHFVRKGLMFTLPWESFQFKIVGEADNGQSALAFMRAHEVDVLITDLTMPIMNGFELMKQVREEFPYVWIVVLTCHQDFAYAQEALQLGAIDYLVKTQIEGQHSYETLQRISRRITHEGSLRHSSSAEPFQGVNATECERWDFLLIPVPPEPMAIVEVWGELQHEDMTRVGEVGWFIRNHRYRSRSELLDALLEQERYKRYLIIVISGESTSWTRGFERYVEHLVFYEFHPDQPVLFEYAQSGQASEGSSDSAIAEELRSQWLTFRWIYGDHVFHEWMRTVQRVRPAKSALMTIMGDTLFAWEFIEGVREMLEPWRVTGGPRCLRDLVSMLQSIRGILRSRPVTEEVAICICKAVRHMSESLHEPLGLEEVAQRVGLSRGYFSQCIRQVTGKSYHDMIIEMRIAHASRLLAETNALIYQVAEQSGFRDEKYFSKVFKHYTGRLPTEFRNVCNIQSRNSQGRKSQDEGGISAGMNETLNS
ncbi:hypothetical protein SY83_12780 [Paenibacillus swuensis]|uniref:AraC family transcriptional regulator n=1 Tax=Paenibacillus swuensis TaxID=1178515 RepID=A0A172TJP5_9BACL|nr:response regulator [Paenibacillus swuensis]ANE47003.1 hypothetical protein SY83_12780 [Paenibacillus swuensis]